MPASLYQALAAELGCSDADAEAAFQALMDDVQRRLQDGDTVTLSGIGTFWNEDGTLHFEPNPALDHAVNARYDHLAPLTPGPAEWDEATEEKTVEDEAPEPVPAKAAQDVQDETVSEEADHAEAKAETPPADVPANVPEKAIAETEEREEPPPTPAPQPARPSPREDAAESSTAQMAGLGIALAALVVLIWFVLGSQGVIPGPLALFSSDAPSSDESITILEAPSATDTTATDTAAAETPPADTAAAPAQQATPRAQPLSIDRAAGGWTIVVASRTSATEARQTLATYRTRFAGDNLPVDLLEGTSGGVTRYRVVVGQFDTRPAALAARNQLQDRLPTDAWTLRIAPAS